jgi:hypothetical protein
MKSLKLSILFIVLSIVFIALGCESNTDSNETGSAGCPTGNGTLEVKVTYNGTIKTDGTGKIYVYLYSSLGTAKDPTCYSASTASEAPIGSEQTITINGIPAGNYYVLILYDNQHHNQGIAGNGDKYELYNNTGSKSAATQVVVSDGSTTSLTGISFDDANPLGPSGSIAP